MILPRGVERLIPDWFSRSLFDTDPNLICYFNPMRSRWIIDRCTRDAVGQTNVHVHTFECPRTNVMIVQDEAGEYMPLCDQVLDKLRSMDTWQKHGSAEEFSRSNMAEWQAMTDKQNADIENLYKDASADNRVQLNHARHLEQQHDLQRPNQ